MTGRVTGRVGEGPDRTAVVIFGAAVRADGSPSQTLRRRVIAAREAGLGTLAPLYVPTGGLGRHGPRESAVMRTLLEEGGVPPDAILEEPTGTDTLSSAFAVAALLRGRAEGATVRVLAVSSGYHLARCVMLLRLAGLPAEKGAAAQPGPGFSEWRWRLREGVAIPYDAAVGAWRRTRRDRPAPAP